MFYHAFAMKSWIKLREFGSNLLENNSHFSSSRLECLLKPESPPYFEIHLVSNIIIVCFA